MFKKQKKGGGATVTRETSSVSSLLPRSVHRRHRTAAAVFARVRAGAGFWARGRSLELAGHLTVSSFIYKSKQPAPSSSFSPSASPPASLLPPLDSPSSAYLHPLCLAQSSATPLRIDWNRLRRFSPPESAGTPPSSSLPTGAPPWSPHRGQAVPVSLLQLHRLFRNHLGVLELIVLSA